MRRASITIALAASVLFGLLPGAAGAAPTSDKPPRITGRAVYLSTLTCHRGTWSADAVAYTYEWKANGVTVSTRPTLKIPLAAIGYNIVCTVTAHDAHGGATSATARGVRPGPASPHLRITTARASGQTITVKGVVSPRQAVSRGTLVLDRRLPGSLTQVTRKPVRPEPDGHFAIKVKDTVRGRQTYVLLYQANSPGFVAQVQAKRTLTPR